MDILKTINTFSNQGFKKIFYTPDEAAEVIAACEEWLIKSGEQTTAFTPDELQGGILKEMLREEDYLAPQQVIDFTQHQLFLHYSESLKLAIRVFQMLD